MGGRQHRIYAESDALKDQIMNDPSSAREFRNVARDPLLQSGPAAGEEALIEIKSAVLAKLVLAVGKDAGSATDRDWFLAAALAIRDRIIHRWLASERASNAKGSKRVYYLSLEFLIGRLWSDVLCNLGLARRVPRRARRSRAWTSTGCGRPSPTRRSATAASDGSPPASWRAWRAWGSPPTGYGIRYDHGLFRQVIKNGWQQEYPEEWLSFGNPWEFARPEVFYDIHFGGFVETAHLPGGHSRSVWRPDETIEAVAYDTPIVGWRGRHVNPLRLWTARAVDPMRLDAFNSGDHIGRAGRTIARGSDLEDPLSER